MQVCIWGSSRVTWWCSKLLWWNRSPGFWRESVLIHKLICCEREREKWELNEDGIIVIKNSKSKDYIYWLCMQGTCAWYVTQQNHIIPEANPGFYWGLKVLFVRFGLIGTVHASNEIILSNLASFFPCKYPPKKIPSIIRVINTCSRVF